LRAIFGLNLAHSVSTIYEYPAHTINAHTPEKEKPLVGSRNSTRRSFNWRLLLILWALLMLGLLFGVPYARTYTAQLSESLPVSPTFIVGV